FGRCVPQGVQAGPGDRPRGVPAITGNVVSGPRPNGRGWPKPESRQNEIAPPVRVGVKASPSWATPARDILLDEDAPLMPGRQQGRIGSLTLQPLYGS